MKKIYKKNEKLIQELLDLRNSRKTIDNFASSYLINFYQNCILMHSHLPTKNRELTSIAYRQYFVFLVSCWETFFRDVFVYINSKDDEAFERLKLKVKSQMSSINEDDITLPELLSKSFNFQNLYDLELAYDAMWDTSFLNYICDNDTGPCGMNGKVMSGLVINNLFSDWKEILNKSFTIRHRVVHDANFRLKLDVNFIQKAEALFLLIPQIAAHFISIKYNLDRIVLSNADFKVPYIFNVSDIISKDWTIHHNTK